MMMMMTDRMQRAMIWRLVDREQELSTFDLARLGEPWRSIYQYVLTQAGAHEDREDALAAAIGQTSLVDRAKPNYCDQINNEIDKMELAAKF